MSQPRIFVLEDDAVTRRLLEEILGAEGFAVVAFTTVTEAATAMSSGSFDLYMLDVVLPDGDGFSCCRLIRQHSRRPIIMLTTRGTVDDIVAGLEIGADDYVTKPFARTELIARIRSALRRVDELKDAAEGDAIRIGELVVHEGLRDATISGRAVGLTPREYEIVALLASRAARTVARDVIMEAIWGMEEVSEKILAVYIRRIRRKIEADPDRPRFLHTVRGIGYRLGE